MGDVIGTSLSTILLYTGVEYATNIYASSLAVSSIAATQFSNIGTATFASNVLHTGGATSYLSNSGLFSNVGNSVFTGTYLSNSGNLSNGGLATFNSNVTIYENFTAIATPSTANSYSLLTLNIPTAGSATTLAPIISLVGGYGASIAGGITQSAGPVLSLGTIAGAGQPTVEGYRMTGTNSVFYGNVTVGTPGSNNTITIQTGGTITVPTGAGGLGNNAYLLLNTPNNTAYLGGDYVYLQPAGNISFYRDFYTSWPATFSSTVNISGRLSNSGNTFLTGTFLSNSGLFSNAGISRFASNVFLTGGTNTSGLSINNTSNINYLQINGDSTTSQSTSPDGGTNYPLVITSPKTGTTIYAMALGVDYTTGYGFINAAGNGATQPILLNSRGGYVGVNCNAPAYQLDVNGIARSGIPISSLTGTYATFSNFSFGIYYYITNSAFSNIALTGTTAPAGTGTAAAPSIGTGWYVTLRNNTGSYLSITVSGTLSSTPASPFTIPPSNATTIAYDSALAGGAGYVFF